MKHVYPLLCLALLAAAACAPTAPAARAEPRRDPNAPSSSNSGLSNLSVTATQAHAVYADTKTGKTLWTADFTSSEAISGQSGRDVTGIWRDVRGIIYANGKPADRFAAPIVTADSSSHTVTASGGVVVTSITQADTSLRCDRMVWYMNENRLVGVGHAVFKKAGLSQITPSFQADTRLRKIIMPAPGLHAESGRRVHAHVVR